MGCLLAFAFALAAVAVVCGRGHELNDSAAILASHGVDAGVNGESTVNNSSNSSSGSGAKLLLGNNPGYFKCGQVACPSSAVCCKSRDFNVQFCCVRGLMCRFRADAEVNAEGYGSPLCVPCPPKGPCDSTARRGGSAFYDYRSHGNNRQPYHHHR